MGQAAQSPPGNPPGGCDGLPRPVPAATPEFRRQQGDPILLALATSHHDLVALESQVLDAKP
jgi:hypothetical protein